MGDMTILTRTARLGGGLLLGTMMTASAFAADPVADFYKGKNVEMLIGYTTGGGYDLYARVVARHIGKHIPGNPNVIPKNVPGAGSMTLANQLANTLPKDGTVIGVVSRSVFLEPLYGNAEAKYKTTDFNWIGSANNEVSVCVSWHTTPIKTYEDMKTKGMVVGGTGPGADTDIFPNVMNNVLKTKLKLVTGYPGGNDVLLAMERGEVDGRCGYSWSSAKSERADWLRDKKINVLLQISTDKHPDLPNVPLIMDLVSTEKEKQTLQLLFSVQAWGRPFVTTPGVPADRVKALQEAFMKAMKDPELLREAEKAKLEIEPLPGPRIDQLIRQVAAAPKDVIEAAGQAKDNTANLETKQAPGAK
jgi:tripartite-type tricarboxylate transporter receptor subunit TctC